METNLPEKPKIADHLVLRDLDNETAIYDSRTGEFHFINPTGSAIFYLCDGTHTVDDIADEILNRFDNPPPTVEGEVHDFLTSLSEKGLTIRKS